MSNPHFIAKDSNPKKAFPRPKIRGFKPEPVVSSDKVGRNEPCPCESGKKFKKCCLETTNES